MNIEFIFTLVISFLIIYIGAITFLHNRNNVTSKLFALISIATTIWAFANYFSLQPIFFSTLVWSRLVLFFAVPHLVLFYFFIKNFPNENLVIPKNKILKVSILGLIMMGLTLTPWVFKGLSYKMEIPSPVPGPLIPLFAIFILSILFISIFKINKKYKAALPVNKKSWGVMLVGFTFSYIALILTNFVLVNTTGDTRFILIAPLIMLPSILGTAYSIKKYRLFNVKTITTELIIFVLSSISLIQIVLAPSTGQFIFNLAIFLIFLLVGILLIKSVYNEVEQREKLEQLKLKLEESNIKLESANEKLKGLDEQKTEFLSLASHQLRTPLTAIKGYISMILEGDYGIISRESKEVMERVFQSTQNLTKIVEDLLNVSKIEQGGMKYEMSPFSLVKTANEMVRDLSINAKNKGLKISLKSDKEENCIVNGDQVKVRQVILNLIDNSIKYTKEGKIDVFVERKKDKVLFSVKDTGMGMTEKIKSSLFQKFSRGEGGKVDSSGSGLGLYLSKEIIEAHNGRIWVESPGLGKGSTFFVELEAIK